LQHLIHGFPLSGPESGHTERDSPTQTRGAIATVLFHPDYNRRPRNHTESADPSSQRGRKALAGLGYVTLTAGGDFRPALRTSAVRNGRPDGKYAQALTGPQAPLASGIGMSPCLPNRARGQAFIGGLFLRVGWWPSARAASAIFPVQPPRDRNPDPSGRFQYPGVHDR